MKKQTAKPKNQLLSEPTKIFLAIVAFLLCYSIAIPLINNKISFGQKTDWLHSTATSDPLKILLPMGAFMALAYIFYSLVESEIVALILIIMTSAVFVIMAWMISFNLWF